MASSVSQSECGGVPLVVIREPASVYVAEQATVAVELADGQVAQVDVYGPAERFGGPVAAQVNWSALGSQSADDAVRYAAAITHAARCVAPTLIGAGGRDKAEAVQS